MFINHNGKIINAHTALISPDNRSFRYGDGLFETIRVINGKIMLEDLHFYRLLTGMDLLQFKAPSYFSPAYFSKQIVDLVNKNQHSKSARVRLMVYRGNGGVFDTENDFPNFIIQSWPLDKPPGLNENGLLIDVFPHARKSCDRYANLKSNNYLPYLMAAKWAKEQHLNDCLILNANERIADACIANIFILKDAELITPPLSEGPVNGVMRMHLLQLHSVAGFNVVERAIRINDILSAEECFLTNAIYGIRWVRSFSNKDFSHINTQRIYNELQQTIY
jgi:branched-chain amino acid aminotransferase